MATVRSGTIYPIETDHLMAPLRMLDGTNTVVWSWEDREPFGASAPTTSGFTFNLHFPGQRLDGETELVSNGFRDYDPVVGRYVESDPLGLEAGFNTYGYANGTPMSSIDTLGLETVSFDSTVGLAQRSSMMQLYTLSKSTLRQDSMMKTLVDQIESSNKEIILTNSADLDYSSKVNGNAVPWNPHLSFKISCSSGLTGYMSQMIGLGHEFNHLINDPNKFVRFLDNLAANHDPRVKIKNFADYDSSYTEYVTINGTERHAQMTFGEATRDNHRYYGVRYVEDPTKPWGRQ